jgi:hypothetical protein
MENKLKTSDRRRSIGDPPHEELKLKRKTDTLLGVIKRIDVVEQWAIEHQDCHEQNVRSILEEFMTSDNFIIIVQRLWQHKEIKEALYTAKNQMVGEIVSAIFSNRMLWLFCAAVIMLLMGYDLKNVKDFLRTILT